MQYITPTLPAFLSSVGRRLRAFLCSHLDYARIRLSRFMLGDIFRRHRNEKPELRGFIDITFCDKISHTSFKFYPGHVRAIQALQLYLFCRLLWRQSLIWFESQHSAHSPIVRETNLSVYPIARPNCAEQKSHNCY